MILINLLPPELRKRGGGVNPVVLSLAGGGVINLLLLAFWAFVQFVRLPHADIYLAERQALRDTKAAEAQQVLNLQAEIANYEKQRDTIIALLAHKMYWARTLDEFANLLVGKWKMPGFNNTMVEVPGFQVCAQQLEIKEIPSQGAERRGASTGKTEEVLYSFKLKAKLVGAEKDKSGDYLRAFFETTEHSPFWRDYGFVGKAEKAYLGDTKKWNADIGRVVIEQPVEWRRAKIVDLSRPAAKAGN